MEMTFLILVSLLGGLWETGAVSVTGEVGQEIPITCTHANAFSNVKYFCKEACTNEDVLITSRGENKDSQRKYSIEDKGNTFVVTISSLTEDDSGTYWCGIERVGLDTYNQVVLTVIKGVQDADDNLPHSITKKLVYIGAGLGLVLLALAILLLIFFRHRNRDIGASPGKDDNIVYATPSSLKQDAHHITTASSTANKHEDTDGRTIGIFSSSAGQAQDTSRDYAREAQNQPDSLFYSTVSFNKHKDYRSVTPPPAAVTYSTIAQISADKSEVYCNV